MLQLNGRLSTVLGELRGQLDGEGAAVWSEAVLEQNYGSLPAGRPLLLPGRTRGFNLLLLSNGRPAHFAKCRPLDDPGMDQETRIVRILGTDDTIRDNLPSVTGTITEDAHIQLARYERGELLTHLLPRMDGAARAAALGEILVVAGRIGVVASTTIPDLLSGRPLRLEAEGRKRLVALAAAGLDARRSQALAQALAAAGAVPRVPQHGDLWPPNVLRQPHGWRLLDFEIFGQIQTPLADACQLIRGSRFIVSPTAPDTWIGALAARGEEATTTRSLLKAVVDRDGLSVAQAEGCIVAYLIEIAARLLATRRPREEWVTLVQAAADAADLLLERGTLDVPGSRIRAAA